MTFLPLLLASLAAAPAAPSPTPKSSEPEIWALVAKINTVPAYEAYLNRFPNGPHHDAAVQAYYRLQGRPVVYVVPPPAPRPAPVVTVAPPPPDPCDELLAAQALNQGDSAEARAFIEARRSNRQAAFQAYLAAFPSGACRERAAKILAARRERALLFKRVPGLGPLAPHRLNPDIFTVDDYPAAALRAEETGSVASEWEVAEDGVVEGCRIVRSSGSAALDGTTCRLITARLRYDPARNAAGSVIRSVDRMSIGWTLPAD